MTGILIYIIQPLSYTVTGVVILYKMFAVSWRQLSINFSYRLG